MNANLWTPSVATALNGSSVLTRAIHHLEDDTKLLIMVSFAGSMLAILFN